MDENGRNQTCREASNGLDGGWRKAMTVVRRHEPDVKGAAQRNDCKWKPQGRRSYRDRGRLKADGAKFMATLVIAKEQSPK